MLDDDECHAVALCVRHCAQCEAAVAAVAFSESEEDLFLLREMSGELAFPIFAFVSKDEILHRARIIVFAETVEEFFLTPKEFHKLVRQYLDRHACASWN
jgi:recombinational DNA repair protein (RecF pathway)